MRPFLQLLSSLAGLLHLFPLSPHPLIHCGLLVTLLVSLSVCYSPLGECGGDLVSSISAGGGTS